MAVPIDFFYLIRRGEITPDQAEKIAQENGFAPLAAKPPPSVFDPMSVASWAPLPAIVWIATRDIEQVRESSDEFRKAWHVWERIKTDDPDPAAIVTGKQYRGWRLDLGKLATFREIARQLPQIYRAKDELWDRLIKGDVPATGLPHGREPRVEITKIEWIDLRIPGDAKVKSERRAFYHPSAMDSYMRLQEDDAVFDCSDRVRSDQGATYCGVCIARKDILKLWPAANAGRRGRKKRGPKPLQLSRVTSEMQKKTPTELEEMKEEEMAQTFGASRDTCRKARNEVLSKK
jgi:hypothetical protein